VAVLVHRVALAVNGAEAVVVVNDAKLSVEVHLHVGGAVPHVSGEVWVRVVNAAVEHGDDDLLAPVRPLPSVARAHVSARRAFALARVD
jgi:hypothetical protein